MEISFIGTIQTFEFQKGFFPPYPINRYITKKKKKKKKKP
jgi:hypothetical protein